MSNGGDLSGKLDLGMMLNAVSRVFGAVTAISEAKITLETNVLPTLDLTPTSEGNGLEANPIVRLIQPTIKVNGSVLYAPAGPARPGVGSWVFIGAVAAVGIVLTVYILK